MNGKAEIQERLDSGLGLSTPPSVGICVLNWNGWRDTLECVESIRRQDYPHFLTVIVDNCSLNDSAERIRSWAHKNLAEASGFVEYGGTIGRRGGVEDRELGLRGLPSRERMVLIRNEENTGFTGGCNTVIDYLLRRRFPLDYIFLINNDAMLKQDCISCLMAVAKQSGAAFIGAALYDESGKEPFFNGRISMKRQFFYPLTNWQLRPPRTDKDFWPSDCVHGGAMLIRADAFRAVQAATGNYFRQGLFMYNEGAELQYHAARLGHHAVTAKNAVVYHKNARSSGGKENPIAYYYTERSRLQVANVVLPFGWKVLFHLVNVPLVSARILKNVFGRRGVAAQAIMEGVVDGYLGRQGKWRRHDRPRH